MSEKPSGYRFEYAPSARAKCKGPKPCSGTPISKGELRFGTVIDMKGVTSFVWRHWGCVTKKIITNIIEKYGEASEIDGFDDLRPEDQVRVTAALKTGEVAPEDVPPSGRKPDEGEEKPKKARKATKKKADDDEGEEEPKKTKAGSSKKAAVEEEGENNEGEALKPRKKAPAKKPAPKEKPAPKKTASKKKAAEDEESGEDFTKDIDNVPAVSDEEEEEQEEEPKPKKKTPAKKATALKRKAPAKTKDEDEDVEMANGTEGDTEESSSKKRKRAPAKTSNKAPPKKAKTSSRAKKSQEVAGDEDDE